MLKPAPVAFASIAILTLMVVTSREASTQVQGSLPSYVKLQSTPPGAAQTGFLNISGTATVGGIQLSPGAASGKVLTSDANGIATWQVAPGLTLPFAGLKSTPQNSGVFVIQNSGNGDGLWGIGSPVLGRGVFATGQYGVYGVGSGGTGIGVFGSGPAYGVYANGGSYGLFATGAIDAVFGNGTGTAGVGVRGEAESLTGATYGGRFVTYSPDGIGVAGYSEAGTGFNYSGYFENHSKDGDSVLAVNYATTGGATAGYFISSSPDSRTVYGLATAATGTSYGVVGQSNSASGGFGVWGTATANGYAVFGQGRLSATTKLFTIDHPLDPENKYLLHYCEEGPEALNVYTGNVVTDGSGTAWVTLPSFYSEINKEPRYTLTVVDNTDNNTFVQAKIAKEIENGRFKIRTSSGNVKVTWRVEGVRNDRWIQRYGAPVETMKPEAQRGLYIHPELYGKSKEMAINYRPESTLPQPRHAARP